MSLTRPLTRRMTRSMTRRLSQVTGAGSWVPTLQAMKAYFAANPGTDNPHSLPEMSAPPTVTVAAGSNAAPAAPYTALTQSALWANTSLLISYEGGGELAPVTAGYRRFPVATFFSSGAGSAGVGINQIVWRAGIIADAAVVGIKVSGSSGGTVAYRVIVNGVYVSKTSTAPIGTGRQYITLDFGTKASRLIEIEGVSANSEFAGFHVAPTDTLSAPPAKPRILLLGNSFTEATGATVRGDGYGRIAGDYLVMDPWLSGVGGTGYLNTLGGTKYKLSERIAADISRALTYGSLPIIAIPMGLNDVGNGDVTAEANLCFDIARALCPNALIFPVTPWDKVAPTAPASQYETTRSQILAAASGRGGVYPIDAKGVAFANTDPHPTDAGHNTLGIWTSDQVRQKVAAA